MRDWRGWIPIGIDPAQSAAPLVWFRLGEHRFDDAYFSDTVARCARHPFNLAFGRRTGYEAIDEAAQGFPGSKLTGIIFHMSRCGSTLVLRLLAAAPRTLVISEAPIVDALVRIRRRDAAVSEEQQIRWLRSAVALLSRASGNHEQFVLKLDAWHSLDIPLFELAFPGVPWTYIYRDPVEVLVSHMARMSYMMSFANAPDLLGITVTDAARMVREEYCARVLERITSAVVAHRIEKSALVRYEEFPAAVWERIAPRFGFALNEHEIDAMRRRAAYDSKNPAVLFQEDTAAKQQAATGAIRAAAALAARHVARLDDIRLGR